MTLQERAAKVEGVWPIPAGVMIETRGPLVSLFMRAYNEHNGTRYIIRHGLNGRACLDHFVPRYTPWRRV